MFHASAGLAQDAPIIQPGAPGELPRELSAEEATEIAVTSHSPDDTLFMQDMIPHHNQAVQMAELVADRTNRPELVDVAGRIAHLLQSSHHGVRYFCSDCGTHVACANDSHPEIIDVTVGSLDDPEGVVPTKDVFSSSRLPWVISNVGDGD